MQQTWNCTGLPGKEQNSFVPSKTQQWRKCPALEDVTEVATSYRVRVILRESLEDFHNATAPLIKISLQPS